MEFEFSLITGTEADGVEDDFSSMVMRMTQNKGRFNLFSLLSNSFYTNLINHLSYYIEVRLAEIYLSVAYLHCQLVAMQDNWQVEKSSDQTLLVFTTTLPQQG